MKLHSLGLIILPLCLLPMLVLGDEPSTRPSAAPRQGPGFPGRPERRLGPMREKGPPPTPAERQAALEFLQQNLPNRYALFTQLRPNSPMRAAVIDFMVFKQRSLTRFKEVDPEVYEQLLSEARLEDDAIGLVKELRDGDASAESKLREKAAQIVQLSLDSRRTRIERLEQALAQQKEQLASDVAHKDERIDERVRGLRKQFTNLLEAMENRRRGGAEKPPIGMTDPPTGSTVSTDP